jgi:hypothetical protein
LELAVLQGMAGSLRRLRPRALVVEVNQRVPDRAGVDGDEIRELFSRLGYESTGQVPPVANERYRPPVRPMPAPPAWASRRATRIVGCDLDRFVPGPGGG